MESNHTKFISVILTGFILGLLIFAGPAQAFILGLVIDGSDNGESNVLQGEEITFFASVNIESMDKYLPVKELSLIFNDNEICKFNANGDIISGCAGITNIERVSVSDYGYGYGYGYDNSYGYGYNSNYGYGYDFGYGYGYNNQGQGQELVYEITLDTGYFDLGEYETNLKVLIGDKTFSNVGDTLIIHYFADEDEDGKISMPELMKIIGRWKADSSDVTMVELMKTISYWKRGYI